MRMLRLVSVLAALLMLTLAHAQEPTEVTWDVASFARVVQPLQHPLGKTPSMMVWNLPLPRGDKLVEMRQDGTLRQAIDIFARRGIVPTVDMGWEWTMAGAMALAQTLQEAGQPVNVQLPRVDLIEDTAYADCPIMVDGPDASRGDAARKWPCLWLAKPEKTAQWLQEQMLPFKRAGIKVAGLWFDDECLPHPWNGCYEAQVSSPECKAVYPPEIIGSWATFKPWADQLKAELFGKSIGPIREMFPGIKIGNYGDMYSGTSAKYGMDATMGSLYANTRGLPGAFKDKEVNQQAVDQFYFKGLLDEFSASAKAQIDGKLNIPYVSRYTPDNPDPKYAFPMSQGPYRELLRHLLLRGADSLYLFNMGYPGSAVTTALSFESVEDARVALDELLARREFFDKGRPLNFAGVDNRAIVWSGLRLPDEALIRVYSINGTDCETTIEPYKGVPVTLKVPVGGAWYVVNRDGTVE